MGANHQHEIEAYCKIAEPHYGLITNVGKAHLEGFGVSKSERKEGNCMNGLLSRQSRYFSME